MYKIFFFILMISFSNTSLSNYQSFLDNKSDEIISSHLKNKNLIGKANYSFLFWNIYDAELYSDKKNFNPNKFAIILNYNRAIGKERLVNETMKDIEEQKKIPKQKLNKWRLLLNSIYQKTEIGEKFIAIKLNQKISLFYYGNKKIHQSNDTEFNDLFFNIWLRKDSKNPQFTKRLLGYN